MLAVTASDGNIASVTMNDEAVVPFLMQQNKGKLALDMAMRADLPGAENVVLSQVRDRKRKRKRKKKKKKKKKNPNQK